MVGKHRTEPGRVEEPSLSTGSGILIKEPSPIAGGEAGHAAGHDCGWHTRLHIEDEGVVGRNKDPDAIARQVKKRNLAHR